MLSQVVVENATPRTFNIEAVSADEILIIKKISGLTSPGNTLYSGRTAQGRGYYQGRLPNTINPVITFQLNPDYVNDVDIDDIRDILYRTFYVPDPGSEDVFVRLVDTKLPDTFFIGYTQNINTDQFAQLQEAMVEMIGLDSYLFAVEPTAGGNDDGWLSVPVSYEGSADTGIEVGLEVRAATSELSFDINGTRMHLVAPFAVDDEIVIKTSIGERSIKKNGVDIMAAMTADSKWPILTGGDSTKLLRTYGTTVADGDTVIKYFTYRAAFWGL